MKKTWMAACLAAFLVLPLTACGGSPTGSDMTTPSAQPSAQPSASAAPDRNPGDDDLAGADGIVGDNDGAEGTGSNGTATGGGSGTGDIGTGNTGNDNAPGQADDSPLEDLGDGVRDTLDDMGSAAREMGRDARNAIEGR